MAQKTLVTFPHESGTDFRHYWNVTKGVGRNRENEFHDVLLVQFLLNSWGWVRLTEDGIIGPKTRWAIKHFQTRVNAQFGEQSLYPDGKVDAIQGHQLETSRSKTVYTILALNMFYLDNKHRTLFYGDITRDPKLPAELRTALAP